MQESMVSFIKGQTCASVCCVDEEGRPWCFTCFYAFEPKEGLLYFKSSPATHHMDLMVKRPWLSGTILPDQLKRLATEGVQFTGEWLSADQAETRRASEKYHLRFPLAIAIPGKVSVIRLEAVKMTSRKSGQSAKIEWTRGEKIKVL